MIEHAPESYTAGSVFVRTDDKQMYAAGKRFWLDHIRLQPENTRILGNAASFVRIEDRELGLELLNRARDMEPNNAVWSERLGEMFLKPAGSVSLVRDRPFKHADSCRALHEFRIAERIRRSEISRNADDADTKEAGESKLRALKFLIHMLPVLANAAFAEGELEAARSYASEALDISLNTEIARHLRDCDDAVYTGNMILGRIALRAGDVNEAKRRLIASGSIKDSPSIETDGPEMTLAKELLEWGERDVVLEFFELCAKFWTPMRHCLDEWTTQVNSGMIPDFCKNRTPYRKRAKKSAEGFGDKRLNNRSGGEWLS